MQCVYRHVYRHVYGHVYRDMCVGMRIDMRIDIRMGMRIDMHIDMCIAIPLAEQACVLWHVSTHMGYLYISIHLSLLDVLVDFRSRAGLHTCLHT